MYLLAPEVRVHKYHGFNELTTSIQYRLGVTKTLTNPRMESFIATVAQESCCSWRSRSKRHTERQRDRETERQRQRHKETERQRQRHTHTELG